MPNQYKNKVIYDGDILVDLTGDTVTPAVLAQGYTAHDASGAPITGTAAEGGLIIIHDEPDIHGGTIRHITGQDYSVRQETDASGGTITHLSAGTVISGVKTITTNGTHDVAMYADAEVNVPTGTARTSADLTASGATVTVPAGLYSTDATKSVASGSATTPATSVTANPSISVGSDGLITATTSATKSVTPTVVAGYVSSGTAGTITVSGSNTSQLSTQAGTTITPTESEQTAVASGKYTTGAVKVGAISSSYVGSGITRRSSTDLTASGATVSVPAGYYSSTASKSVASGSEGTPTATKGTVSNHQVSVTPSVTNTAGYISGSTKTGTAVTVTASELASGNKEITDNGTNIDVVGYSTVSVDVASSNVYTATLDGTGDQNGCYVQVNGTGTKYYTDGDAITYEDGDNLLIAFRSTSGSGKNTLTVNGVEADSNYGITVKTCTVTNPRCDMTIEISYGAPTNVNLVLPSTSITANGLSQVGGYAYANVNVPGMGESDLRAYLTRNSASFTTIDWPTSTTQIGKYAFADCTYFNPPSLPSGLQTIGYYAFNGCTRLALTSLPSAVYILGGYAFQDCKALALTSLPSGIESIPTYCFSGCTNLALSSLPNGLLTIKSYAFRSSGVTISSLPSGLTQIEAGAFQGCTGVTISTVPSGITKIDMNVFSGCTGITSFTVPSSVTSIGQSSFSGCTSLASITLPDTITSIGVWAFQNCTSLTSVSCDGELTNLSASSFLGDSTHSMTLTSASFPNLVMTSQLSTVFGSGTAANACQLLEFCDIGKVAGITTYAFQNCCSLTKLVLRKTGSVASLGNINAFTNTPMSGYNNLTGTVYVPSALISSYQTATNWKTLYDAGTVTFTAIEGSPYEL
jgi:hypothetical protein